MSWTDTTTNNLGVDNFSNQQNYIASMVLTSGKQGDLYSEMSKDTTQIDRSVFTNNSFNNPIWPSAALTPYPNYLIGISTYATPIFLIFLSNSLPEDVISLIDFADGGKAKSPSQFNALYPEAIKIGTFPYQVKNNAFSYDKLTYAIIDRSKFPSQYGKFVLFENWNTETQRAKAQLLGILVPANTLQFTYNHEISSTLQPNFNGATFTAQSGAIKKYQLGNPEVVHNLNFKIENLTEYENFKSLQLAAATTGNTVILKEKDNFLFLSDATLSAEQIANLVWNITINGKEKI